MPRKRAIGKPFDQLAPRRCRCVPADLAAGKVTDARVVARRTGSRSWSIRCSSRRCFADPIYGGNRDKVFWKLIGYPGLPAFHAQRHGAVPRQAVPGRTEGRQSIDDFS